MILKLTLNSQNLGLPQIINNTEEDNYYLSDQIWDIKKLDDGNIYYITNHSLIIYNGFNHKILYKNNNLVFRSFNYSSTEKKFYIGSNPEIISLDINLKTKTYSIPFQINTIWKTICWDDSLVYFLINKKYILLKKGNNLSFINGKNFEVYRLFNVKKTIYGISESGLGKINVDKIEVIDDKNKNLFSQDIRIFIPKSQNEFILGNQKGNLYLYNLNTKTFINFITNFDTLLKNSYLYSYELINDSTFAVSTLKKGIFIFNAKGNLLYHLNADNGLSSNIIYSLYYDNDYGILWAGTEKGLCEIHLSQLHCIDNRYNIKSSISFFNLYDNKLIIGTYDGLYLVNKNVSKLIDNKILYANNIQKLPNGRIIISSYQKLSIFDSNFKELFNYSSTEEIKFALDSNILIFNDINNNLTFYRIDKNIEPLFTLKDVKILPNFIYIDKYRNIWLPDPNILLVLKKNNNDKYQPYYYDKSNGLLHENIYHIFEYKDTIFVCYNQKTYYLTNPSDDFKNFKFKRYDKLQDFTILKTVQNQNSLYAITKENFLIKYTGNELKKLHIKGFLDQFFINLILQNSKLIFNSRNKIYIIDTNDFNNTSKNIQIGISEIKIDTLIYNSLQIENLFKQKNKYIITLPPKSNSIKIEFSFLGNLKKYDIELFVEDIESREITPLIANILVLSRKNLQTENFKIFAIDKNTKEIIGTTEIEFVFSKNKKIILFLISTAFVLTALIFTILFVTKKIKRLKFQKKELEHIIRERTQKLEEQKEELQIQAQELLEQKKILESETRRLNNLLHELKLLSIVAQKTHNGILIINKYGRFDWWNRSFIETFEELFNKYNYLSFKEIHKYVRPDIYKEIKNYSPDKGIIQYIANHKISEKKNIWLQTTIIPVDTEKGTWFIVIDNDISEIKNLENSIQAYQSLLEEYKNNLNKNLAEYNLLSLNFRETLKNQIKDKKYISLLETTKISGDQLPPILEKFFTIDQPAKQFSGDFYNFLKLKNNKYLLTVGDATGHNIHGVVIKTITINLLKDLIYKNNPENFQEIITLLNQKLFDIFLQTQNDLVNIAFLIFEDNSLEIISFNIPILIFSKNEAPFIYKGQRQNLGVESSLKIEKINFNIDETTQVYITTDGLTNTFNKMGTKKFSLANFKEILSNIQKIDFSRHREIILTEIEMWKGNFPQNDDILVVGLKLNPSNYNK